MDRDIDDELEQLQPPAALLDALKPDPKITVKDFLALAFPQRPGHQKIILNALDWFSASAEISENDIPVDITSLVLPSARICRALDDNLRDALQRNQCSVHHPVKENIFIPLWLARAWKWGGRMLENRTFWLEKLAWVVSKGEHEGWEPELVAKAKEAINSSPWQNGLSFRQRGAVTVHHLAQVMLSSEWLTGDAVDCLLDTIREEMKARGAPSSVQVAGATLCQGLEHGVTGAQAVYWTREMAEGRVKRLMIPWNIPWLHWLWFEVDVERACIMMSDTKLGVTAPHLDNILLALHRWLKTSLPSIRFESGGDEHIIDVAQQLDSFSCGIGMSMGIRRRVLPLSPLWDPLTPFKARAESFIACVFPYTLETERLKEAASTPFTSIEIGTPPIVEVDHDGRSDEYLMRRRERHRTYAAAESSYIPSSSSETETSESDDGYTTPPPAMKTKVSTASVSKDTSTDSKKKTRKRRKRRNYAATTIEGPAWFNDPNFMEFQRKVFTEDPDGPDFSRKDQRIVICGRCRKPVPMRQINAIAYFKSHRQSAQCQKGSGSQTSITRFLVKGPTPAEPAILPRTLPCPGLTNVDDPNISSYLRRTVVSFGGVSHRTELKKKVLEQDSSLASKKKQKVLDARILEAERMDAAWENHHATLSVHSTTCLRKVTTLASLALRPPCFPCRKLLTNKIFNNALAKKPKDPKNAKHTPRVYRNPIIEEVISRHKDVHELLFMPENARWLTLAQRASKGRYEGYEAFMGICAGTVAIEDRIFHGKGLQNMRHDTAWDAICTNIALISPRLYRMVQKEIGGPHIRTIQRKTAKTGRFQAGADVAANFDSALKWVQDMGYTGPLGLAVDDTGLTRSVRTYKDGEHWKVAGVHGVPITIKSYEELLEFNRTDRSLLADKVRAWILIVPIPGIPPKLLATLPICSKVGKTEIASWHASIERGLHSRGLQTISYNVDGHAGERGFGHELEDSATKFHVWQFHHPLLRHPPLKLRAPLLESGIPRVVGTDGKHTKKNGRGSATSGARVLAMGNYLVHYGMLSDLAQSENTPLLKSDIIGVDKQDDRAAARLFSSAVISQIKATQPDELGLATYLFILGEVIDAQQNRFLRHDERVKMLWRARFFLEGWRSYVVAHPHYNVNTHFITRELYDILSIFINAMLSLILVHRDFFPHVPLALWLHSTEVVEHFYGCARQIQKEFTAEQWMLMVPKIILLMMGQMKQKGSQASGRSARNGYHHSWFDSTNVDVANLATFPSDDIFQEMIDIAFFEAAALLGILGMDALQASAVETSTSTGTSSEAASNTMTEDPEESQSSVDSSVPVVPVLEDLLALDGQDADAGTSIDLILERRMLNAGTAAVADALHHAVRIDELPEHGQTEEDEWRQSVLQFADVLQKSLHRIPPPPSPEELERRLSEAGRQAAIKSAKSKALQFGTVESFNFDALITARTHHETDEVKNAIAYRFQNATSSAERIQEAVSQASMSKSAPTAQDNIGGIDESPSLDPQVLSQLSRLVSDSLTGSGKHLTTSGLERLARWKMVGLSGKMEEFDLALPTDEVEASNIRRQMYVDSRRRWSDLSQKTIPLNPVNGGISPLTPLRAGSWILVYFTKKIYVAQVKIIYVEGGGKTATHNFTPSCSEIYKISRLVALLFEPYTMFYSPVFAQPSGYRQMPTFAFLHQANIIGSIDFLGTVMRTDIPSTQRIKFGHNLFLEQPSNTFTIFMDSLREHLPTIRWTAEQVIDACNARKKRAAGEGSAGTSQKKQRTG